MIRARFEFKKEDCWVGVFWRWSTPHYAEPRETNSMVENMLATHSVPAEFPEIVTLQRIDVWVCIVPWFPIHVVWERETIRESLIDNTVRTAMEVDTDGNAHI